LKLAPLKNFITPITRASLLIFLLAIIFYGIFHFNFFPGKVVFSKYQVAAKQYLEDNIPGERRLDYSPLYLYLNIFARKYFENPYRFILWIQIILVSFSMVFLFLLLKLFFNWTLSLLGTAAFLINKSLILYTRAFEPEPLLIFFILGFVYFATRLLVMNTGTKITIFLSGLFLGLSILTRSNFFPIALLTPVFFLIRYKDRRKFLRHTMIFGAPILIITAFLVLRNSIISQSFTIFQMNPGQVFFEGNNPNSWGESATYPPLVNDFSAQFKTQSDFQHAVYRYFARKIKNQSLSLNQVNWFWTRKGLNFIFDHPIHFFKRLLAKVNFIFHNYRRHDLADVFWNDKKLSTKFPTIPLALISAMAIFGMLFSVKKYKERLFVYAVLLWQVGLMLLLYVSDRQRVVIVSMMIFFAVDFLNWMLSKRKNIFVGLLVLVIAPLLYFENQLMKDEGYLWLRYSLADQAMIRASLDRKNGNLTAAVQENALSLAYAPWQMEKKQLSGLPCKEKDLKELSLRLAVAFGIKNPSSLFDLGVLFLENGKLSEAEYILKILAEERHEFNRQYAQSSLPEFYLARVYELKGDKTAALSCLEKALKRNPGDPWVLARFFALSGNPAYKKKLSRYFDEIDVQFFLGKALLEAKKFPEAVECFSYVKEKLPQYRKGLIYLCIALGAVGEYQKAVENYLDALALSKDPVFAEEEIIAVFKKFAAQNSQDPETKKLLKMVLNQFGCSQNEE
jgi:tetratricopeptide (TPR) repeat protein